MGTFEERAGASKCEDAHIDHYVDAIGSISQSPCPTGTSQPLVGQSKCVWPFGAESPAILFALLGAILVFGLGGWTVMRRRRDVTGTEADEHTHSVEAPVQPVYETEPEPEMNTGQFLEEPEADLSRPTPPPHAKMNEQGQLVWVDDAGTAYAQNPDGSMVTFNVSTGCWEPLE